MPIPDGFVDATRVQRSLLSALERRALVWMARRLPERVTPDHLTALGLVSLAAAGALYAAAPRWPAALLVVNVCLVANWLGDSLDGTVARVRQRLRPRYGFYVDHVVDAFGALFVLGGLSISGFVTPAIAVALLVAFLLFSIEVYLATYTLGRFRLSYALVGPTELRLLLAAGNTAAFLRPRVVVFGVERPFFDAGMAIGAVVMTAVLVATVVRHARTLAEAERP